VKLPLCASRSAPEFRRPRPGAARSGLAALLALALPFTLAAPRAAAFPPAPFYTLYGIVRDQVGATLEAEGAEIVLIRDNVEIGRAPVWQQLNGDKNYELALRLDHARPDTRTYSTRTVPRAGLFTLYVSLNGRRVQPIEVAGNLRAGSGGEHVRIDLTLGVDTDHDGLPDAWEEWQLHQAGHRPGSPGWSLAAITRDGDYDGDGVSNFSEYVAGTFAGDATQRFELRITGKTAGRVAFEFYAITGKTYGIEQSTDLRTWSPAAFSTAVGAGAATSWRATAVGVQPAFVTTDAGPTRFFRLTVR
jgi:hypothetical protein